MGLSRQHHSELNAVYNVKPGRYDELRQQYAQDPVALQQIDVYDGSTLYHVKLNEYANALKSKDFATEKKLEQWFKDHYPDIGG
jgi:hypothetical protein